MDLNILLIHITFIVMTVIELFQQQSMFNIPCYDSFKQSFVSIILFQRSPIHELAKMDSHTFYKETVQRVLKDKDSKDYLGKTPLHVAVENNNLEFGEAILKGGACLHIRTGYFRFGKTALHISAEKGHKDFVDLLLQWKANVNEKAGISRKTALHLCVENVHEEIANDLLAAGADVNLTDGEGRTALHIAVCRGGEKLVQSLLERGAEINVKDIYGKTALHYCTETGNNIIINRLLKTKASANIRDSDGKTALHNAAYYGHNESVLTLVKVTDFIDTGDNYDKTALHYSSQRGHAKVVKALLEAGAGVDVKDRYGKTPLHYSAEANTADVMRVLIQNGANLDIADSSGQTALDVATRKSNDDAVAILKRNGAMPMKDNFNLFNAIWLRLRSHGVTASIDNSAYKVTKQEDTREKPAHDTDHITVPTQFSIDMDKADHNDTNPLYGNNVITSSITTASIDMMTTGLNQGETIVSNITSIDAIFEAGTENTTDTNIFLPDVNVLTAASPKVFAVNHNTATVTPHITGYRQQEVYNTKRLKANNTSTKQMGTAALGNTTPTANTASNDNTTLTVLTADATSTAGTPIASTTETTVAGVCTTPSTDRPPTTLNAKTTKTSTNPRSTNYLNVRQNEKPRKTTLKTKRHRPPQHRKHTKMTTTSPEFNPRCLKNPPGFSIPPRLQEKFTQTNLEMFGENLQTFFEKHQEMLDDLDGGQENKPGQSQTNDKQDSMMFKQDKFTKSFVKKKKKRNKRTIFKSLISYHCNHMNISEVKYLSTNGDQNFISGDHNVYTCSQEKCG
ncbi:serine/threonine-protein phosphatase 6 regulatory ankyrin repeat subunit A-like isoform X2 [Physella acuta]|nr:serine/threonine-protein phosphatase 6 regulatory ankyrin repeat subunit A-like isoform X2 [Physella acuta]